MAAKATSKLRRLFGPLKLAFLALQVVAVLLGRLAPSPVAERRLRPERLGAVSVFSLADGGEGVLVVDADRGTAERAATPEGDRMDLADCSRWVDGAGERQLVGRWVSTSGRGGERIGSSFGLARWTYPGGRVLDRVETSTIPTSPVSWYPGTDLRVLFAAGDGRLYRLRFDDTTATDLRRDPESVPTPLDWRVASGPRSAPFLSDPRWISHPTLGELVLVAASDRGADSFRPSQIWWLKLDPSGGAVVAAGRVTEDDRPDGVSEPPSERFPSLIAGPGEPPVIAYLAKRGDRDRYELRAASLSVDAASGGLRVAPLAAKTVRRDCLPVAPLGSADGQGISYFVPDRVASFRLCRTDLMPGRTDGRPPRIVPGQSDGDALACVTILPPCPSGPRPSAGAADRRWMRAFARPRGI